MPETNHELKIVEFGNPILRSKSRRIKVSDIKKQNIKQLIGDMRKTLVAKKLGVGLAAPQVGYNLALSVTTVLPTKHRKIVEEFDQVIINPKYEGVGRKKEMWEGCISAGSGSAGLFALTPRFEKVKATFYDEKGKRHQKTYEGLIAQIFQHETDHLNGILFVDLVKNTKSYCTMKEYKKMINSKKIAIINKNGK